MNAQIDIESKLIVMAHKISIADVERMLAILRERGEVYVTLQTDSFVARREVPTLAQMVLSELRVKA